MFNSLLHYFVNFVVVIVEGTESVFSSTRYDIDTSGTLEIFKREREREAKGKIVVAFKKRSANIFSLDRFVENVEQWNSLFPLDCVTL